MGFFLGGGLIGLPPSWRVLCARCAGAKVWNCAGDVGVELGVVVMGDLGLGRLALG